MKTISKIQRLKRNSGKDSAVCRINIDGRVTTVSLGAWKTTEAQKKYEKTLKDFVDGKFDKKLEDGESETMEGLYLKFLKEKEGCISRATYSEYKYAVQYAIEIIPNVLVEDFDSKHVAAVKRYYRAIANLTREESDGALRRKGVWSRQYVNKLLSLYTSILRYLAIEGLLPMGWVEFAKKYPGYKPGEAPELSETKEVDRVSDSDVVAVLPYMSDTIRDMVLVMRGACMRPSELCNLTIGQLDKSNPKLWTATFGSYKSKNKHKNSHRGFKRYIAFSEFETDILRKYSAGRSDDEHVFRPDVEVARRYNWKSVLRDSYAIQRVNNYYSTATFSRAVSRAIRRAIKAGENVKPWTLYQLRHSSYTENSKAYGEEKASMIAGHRNVNMAVVYDHKQADVAIEAAASRKPVFGELEISNAQGTL